MKFTHSITRRPVFLIIFVLDHYCVSDADFLVTFKPAARNDLAAFTDLKEALERLLGRPVDLIEREAVEASRNFIRRRAILKEAETVYG